MIGKMMKGEIFNHTNMLLTRALTELTSGQDLVLQALAQHTSQVEDGENGPRELATNCISTNDSILIKLMKE